MKAASRLLFLAGAIAIGLFFLRATPREVTLVYGVGGSGARSLEVEIDRGAKALRRAEFRLPDGATQVSHRVKLADGTYALHFTVRAGAEVRHLDRPLEVTESGTLVLPLGP